jgi:hydroxymethylpyrimidine pyrophosphatase-like HAD family hydrolase
MTKAVTVATELDRLGCAPASVVAFGDMPNDLHMLSWAARGCVVANGHPSVLAAADEVVPSNDDDGVARTVDRLLAASTAHP